MELARDIHFPTCFDFKFYKLYMVWIEYEKDELLVNESLKIITFKTEEQLLQYWRKHIREEYREVFSYNAFNLQQWLISPSLDFECCDLLNFWNFFTDVSESVKLPFLGDVKESVRNSVYDKLFDGSGVFIAEDPNPVFSDSELRVLADVLKNGLDLLLNNIAVASNE